jgi:endo-1,4-beta-D-glucanase Y
MKQGCCNNCWYVQYEDSNEQTTVSEAIGYGMVLTAAMADQDSDAQEMFDGLWLYY